MNFTFFDIKHITKSGLLVVILKDNITYSFSMGNSAKNIITYKEIYDIINSEINSTTDLDSIVLNSLKKIRKKIVIDNEPLSKENIVNLYNDFYTSNKSILFVDGKIKESYSSSVLEIYMKELQKDFGINFYLFITSDTMEDTKEFMIYVINNSLPNEQKEIYKDNITYAIYFYNNSNKSVNNFEISIGKNHQDLMNNSELEELTNNIKLEIKNDLFFAAKKTLKEIRGYSYIRYNKTDKWDPQKLFYFWKDRYNKLNIIDIYCYINNRNLTSIENDLASIFQNKRVQILLFIINKYQPNYNIINFTNEFVEIYQNYTNNTKYAIILISGEDHRIDIDTNKKRLLSDERKNYLLKDSISLLKDKTNYYNLVNKLITEIDSSFQNPENWDTEKLLDNIEIPKLLRDSKTVNYTIFDEYNYLEPDEKETLGSKLQNFTKINYTFFIIINSINYNNYTDLDDFSQIFIDTYKNKDTFKSFNEEYLFIFFEEYNNERYVISNKTKAGQKISNSIRKEIDKYIKSKKYSTKFEKYFNVLNILQKDLGKTDNSRKKLMKIIYFLTGSIVFIILIILIFLFIGLPKLKGRRDKPRDINENRIFENLQEL